MPANIFEHIVNALMATVCGGIDEAGAGWDPVSVEPRRAMRIEALWRAALAPGVAYTRDA